MLIIKSIYLIAVRYVFKGTRVGLKITQKEFIKMQTTSHRVYKPTQAYISATWAALAIGVIGYLVGLWNANILLNEKGYYLAIFILAMFSAVTLQKTVRDKQEGLPTTTVFVGMCWAAFFSSIALLGIGLFNADMFLSEKGFYGMAFILSLFAIITVQKNIRDLTNDDGTTLSSAYPGVANSLDVALETTDIVGE
jgi:uncharacterized membrane protein YiaA|tara:strand:- start:129 stop:713 length:585 start_codon:yes stop_codon:yes gene_type:complete